MRDAGYCLAVEWLDNDDAGIEDLAVEDQGSFEIGRFPIKPVWTGHGVEWRRTDRRQVACVARFGSTVNPSTHERNVK